MPMPPLRIRFDGPWTDAEETTIRDAIERAEAHMSPTQRDALRGQWIATLSEANDDGKYVVVHRRGMGAALAGQSASEVARQIGVRWGNVGSGEAGSGEAGSCDVGS